MKRTVFTALILLLCGTMLWANGGNDDGGSGMDTITFFMGHSLEDYPAEGTIVGDYIEEQTGVVADFEFLVGELEQKVGIMIASGEYPDVINGRNFHQKFIDAGACIPLEDLIAEHGPNIQALYGDYLDRLVRDDGHIYFLPAFVPTENIAKVRPDMGFYIQARVLEEFGYPDINTVDEYFDLIRAYTERHPTTESGQSTIGFTSLFYSWRDYTVMNIPSVVTGHPNDGSGNVDYVNGEWVVSQYYDSPAAYEIYSVYNDLYNEGLFDPEAFVADYDQYKAKLLSGRVLGFFDQDWSINQDVNDVLKNDDNDTWYVCLPVVFDGYQDEMNGPIALQVDQGVSISVNCDDPVTVIEYFDFLCREETQRIIAWGFEGQDYLVDDDGMFYRNEEQRARFATQDYDINVQGNKYFNYMMPGYGSSSMFADGNSCGPDNQPSEFYAKLTPAQQDVLDAYGIMTWNELFAPMNMEREIYFPLWTGKMETGSIEEIASQKLTDLRKKFVPLLIMAEPGTYDDVWNEFLDELSGIDNLESINQFYQDLVDTRVAEWGN